ncbi:ras-related protein rab-5c [Anaeramoeba ignava]|uniref:Ras-related protein rab-5c n=1 Tax=Anaeramoeba ignava TaxID=1746090 RepID=A0A9Q0RIR1_ANAIG|nr:ras-related protein rab-5c [Anaeramoeba ignava]
MESIQIDSKVVILGDSGVGKTSIALRFTQNEFFVYQLPTIGAQCMDRIIKVGDNMINFSIWDTAGQERFRSLAPMYYRNAVAAIIVYDITQMNTFEIAKNWINEILENGNPNVILALVGNKLDLEQQRNVKIKIAEDYSREQGIIFLETSAKTGDHIDDLFIEIAKKIPITPKKIPRDIETLNESSITKKSEKSSCC